MTVPRWVTHLFRAAGLFTLFAVIGGSLADRGQWRWLFCACFASSPVIYRHKLMLWARG